jgi:hypothetical protein
MTTGLLIMQPLVLLAVLALVVYMARGYVSAATETAQIALKALQDEREAQNRERQTLLQRIQAPQAAIIDHSVAVAGPPPNGRPLSEEESAIASDDRLAQEIAAIQARELAELQRMGLVTE